MSNKEMEDLKYETAVTESGDPINPAEFYDEELEEVDWVALNEEMEY